MRRSAFLFSMLTCALVLGGCQTASMVQGPPASKVRLHSLFTDNMVIQRDAKPLIWGWADPGGVVSVAIDGQEVRVGVDASGEWRARLRPIPTGGPYTLSVRGQDEIVVSNVLVGDVWIASGQSNMQMPVKVGNYGVNNGDAEIAAADYPSLRLFSVPRVTSFEPLEDTGSDGWQVCSPDSVPAFSAVAYFFGRQLNEDLNVPIGMIHTSWGGTPAEAWTSAEALSSLPDYAPVIARMAEEIPGSGQAEEKYAAALAAWQASLDERDRGARERWFDPETPAAGWETMELPTTWESAGLTGVDGFVWFRREINLPQEWAGKDLTLRLGPINDRDRSYFNGVEVGRTESEGQADMPRVYTVPGAAVKSGSNVISVRVHDVGNVGGIYGPAEQMQIEYAYEGGFERLLLAGPWQYRVGFDVKTDPPPPPPVAQVNNPHTPMVLYNGMIAPLVPLPIRGAIWYQGESNAARAYQYRTLFSSMIQDWRVQWNQGAFPFLFVQLANFKEVKAEPGDDDWAELREAQTMALALPSTGMASAIDIGEAADIHPKNKQDVGRRLALAARHVAYGQSLPYSGPMYRSMKQEGDGIRLLFEHAEGGLMTKDGEAPKGFAIAGEDRKFVWANARIEGDSVLLSSPDVPRPVAVRYAWASNPVTNLYNQIGLPTNPFRTDQWPGITEGVK